MEGGVVATASHALVLPGTRGGREQSRGFPASKCPAAAASGLCSLHGCGNRGPGWAGTQDTRHLVPTAHPGPSQTRCVSIRDGCQHILYCAPGDLASGGPPAGLWQSLYCPKCKSQGV